MIGARQYVDVSERTALALCSCGWRSGPHDARARAWSSAHAHALIAHPGEIDPITSVRASEARRVRP